MLDGVLTSMQQSSSPPHGKPFGMHKALVIGNGESRSWFKPCHQYIRDNTVITWGCNALYRDGYVHNLVAVDYGMQQEIYDSGYCLDNPEYGDIKIAHFANWSPVPAEIAEMMFMGLIYQNHLFTEVKKEHLSALYQAKTQLHCKRKLKLQWT